MKRIRNSYVAGLALAAILALAGCGSGDNGTASSESGTTTTGANVDPKMKGEVKVDGSSTVMPISARASEAFKEVAPDVHVPVGEAGTGSGMKKFIAGEIDICDASRPIKAEEIDSLKTAGIDFVELPIAYDGLSIVVNKEANWIDSITTDELKKIWEPASTVKNWNEVRPTWPAKPMTLQGPATNHGTYEYFAEAIVKDKSKATRQDYQQNQEYNALVQGVSGDANALGYVGYAYYAENQDKLKLVSVDAGKGAIAPSPETIMNGTYAPLSRPLFMYVSKKALDRPEVKAFVQYYLDNAKQMVSDAKYIPLPDETYKLVQDRFKNMTLGSVFSTAPAGSKVEDLLGKK